MATIAETLAQAVHCHRAGNLRDAETLYCHILQTDPGHADAHHLFGALAYQTRRYDQAVTSIRQALTLKPSDAVYHNNLGLALAALGQLSEATASYRQALRLQLDLPEVRANLAIVLFRQGAWDEALAHYQQALRLQPGFVKAHNDLALLFLLRGNYQQGWPEYEWRWQQPGVTRPQFKQPLWDGSELEGRIILLHAEQGLGDTLQFARFAALVKQRGGITIVECQPALVRLLGSAAGIDCAVAGGSPLPSFDIQAPLLSLPGILGITPDTIPATIPYLFADPGLVECWRRELQPLRGFKIGIAWQGCPTFRYDRERSIPLQHFARLAAVEGVQLIGLQKGPGTDQLRHLAGKFSVTDFGNRFDETSGPFMDTAAIMMSLDLVISSDTAIAHLAGALGVPVWTALPLVPDWRWLLQREDSPWYPTMRLFRQTRAGNWNDVFDHLAGELQARLHLQPRPLP